MDNWLRCPRCNSKRVRKVNKKAYVVVMFGSAGCLILVGLFFPPAWIGVPILLILSVLMLFGRDALQCQDCNYSWAVNKSTDNTKSIAQNTSESKDKRESKN